MKINFTTTLFFILCFFALNSFSQSRLTISAAGNSFLRVNIDGRYDKQGTTIAMNDFPTGYHNIKVYADTRNGRIDTYGGNNLRLVFSGSVFFKPMHHVDILINRFGKALVDEQQLSRFDDFDDDEPDFGGGYRDRNNRRRNEPYDRYRQAMSPDMFQSAKEAIRREGFDNSRLAVAKQIVNSNYMNALQVKEILSLFSFEESKLDLAKFAYTRTIDPNNYFLLYDAFTFPNAKEALARYIREMR